MIRRAFLTLTAAAAVPLALPAAAYADSGRGGRPPAPRVFVAGDSTASTYAAHEAPRAGWGQALPVFQKGGTETVNLALSGASSKSFADLGLLDRVLDAIGPGDLLLVSFGHNDAKKEDPARYTEPYGSYQEHLRRYTRGARARGARPVLVTSVERRRFDADGRPYASHGDYPEAMRQVADQDGEALVDLAALSLARWAELGVEGTKEHFLWLDQGEHPNYPDGVQDNTHFQAHGAVELARLVTAELRRLRLLHPRLVRRLDEAVDDDAPIWPPQRPV